MALLPTAGLACRARQPDKAVLLETLPAEAQGSAVIARVVVTDVNNEPPKKAAFRVYANARVIQAIKGVEVGRVIRIQAGPWPCIGTLSYQDIGRDGFIAGEFTIDQTFVGFWDLQYARMKDGG